MEHEEFNYSDEISALDQRILVLRRYKKMLELQRDSLGRYLEVIDARELAVTKGEFAELEEYTALEQQAIKGILTVQQCIEPIKTLFLSLNPESAPEIIELEQRLERLRVEILKRNQESHELLRAHADVLKRELTNLRVQQKSMPTFSQSNPVLVDIMG